MDLNTIRALKEELEHRLRAVADEAVRDFQTRTGLEVNSIHIGIIHLDTIGLKVGRGVVKDCRIGVEI